MKMTRGGIVIVIIVSLLLVLVAAAEESNAKVDRHRKSNHILLRRKTIDVEKEFAPFVMRSKKQQQDSFSSPSSWLWSKPSEAEQIMVHYGRKISADDHFAIESLAGAGSVLAYVPSNTYLVQIPRASMKTTIQELDGVKWIGPMLPEYKISEHLHNESAFSDSFDPYAVSVHILTPECASADDYELRHQCIERVVQSWREYDDDLQKLAASYDVNVTVLAGGISEVLVKWSEDLVLGLESAVRARVVQWAAEKLEVHWVEVRLVARKQKLKVHDKWAVKLVQSRNQYPTGGRVAQSPLRGEGQIIGVSDTGIDHDHCFFYDPSNPVPFNTVNKNHRKIVLYDTVLGDNKDFVDGHGTHISGTAAGACYNSTSTINEWAGMAPLAKIAFIDMANDLKNANGRDLNYPSDLGKEIYSKVYTAGGRIMSESWGGEPQGYPTSHTQMMDQFQYDKPDFLIVRSAGNEGDHYVSLNTQAASKNCLVVGASQSSNDSYVDTYTTFYDYTTPFLRRRRELCFVNASFCNVTQAICCENSPMGTYFNSTCCPQYRVDQVRRYVGLYNQENMVSSSSKGPTWDARIKPDVVAPGEYVVNARSDGNTTSFQSLSGNLQQNLIALSGTSMSTPLVAGAAAIIREYLVKGYYNSSDGTPNPARVVLNPPAALIKAMIINSARPLRGLNYQAGSWVRMTDLRNTYYTGANFVEGFGALALDQILPFGNASGFQLSLPNLGNRAIAGNESHQYCYNVLAPGEVWITLTWTEHPGSPITVIQLINDLDLIVMRNSGPDTYSFFGNMPFDRFGTGYTADTLNNVERVMFSVKAGDSIRFNISGSNVPFRVQPYAVAMRSPAVQEYTCKECFGTERRSCHIPNGVGQKRCVNGKWGPCLVVACASDYTVDAWKNRCKRFMQYYQVNLIASGIMGLIAAFFCLPFYCYDRQKMKKQQKYGNVPLTQAELQKEAGPWEMYTVVKPNLALTIMGSLIGLGAQTSTLIQPLFVGKLIQQLNDNAPWGSVRNTLFLIILSAVCELVLGTVSGWIMQVAEEANLLLLRHRLYETIMLQRYNFFERRDLSELQNRLIVDCSSSVGFPSQFLNSLFGSLSRLIVAMIMIFSISPHLSFVFLAMVPVFGLIAYVFGRLIQPITVKQLDLSSRSATIAWDCLKNIRVVKAYGQIAQEIQRYKTATTESYDLNIKISVITTLARLSNTSLTEAAAIVFLWYGSILVLQPRISTGLLLSFTLYVGYAVAGCSAIFNLWPSYKKTIGAMDKVFAILRLKPDIREETPMKALSAMVADPKGVRGEISVQNLSFHYEGQEHKMVIKRLNLEMRPGRLHIVTGPSGAGKSTLINLVTRLYDPTSGSIVVDGTVDLSTLRPIDLIALVSIIEQEPKIFNRTVQENLTYGSPEVSDWRIEEISKLCNVHDFVIQLPEAYQTVIGEDSTGVRLSGGQKQRICMARALMKDCRILLLDEPTNDLDIENEKLLLDIIYQLAKNKLVILITHHLNLVRENESVVYFMENGVIREQGSHSQLMALRGRYFRFVQLAQLMQNPEAGDLAQSFHQTSSRIPPQSGGGGGGGLLPPRGGGGGGGALSDRGGQSESERSEREDDPRRGLLPRAGTRGAKQ